MSRRIKDIKGCHGWQQAQVLRQAMAGTADRSDAKDGRSTASSAMQRSEIEQQGDMAHIHTRAIP